MADPAAPGIRETGRRVEHLLDSLACATEPQLRMHAEELVGVLVGLYGAGLSRIVSIIAEQPEPEAARLADLLAEDELVSGLLVLHGLHPLSVHARIQAVIDDLRPTLGQPPPEIDLVGVGDDGTVRLRWTTGAGGCGSGGCGGASGPSGTQRLEAVILDAVADVNAVEIEQVQVRQGPALIPVESLFRDRAAVVNR